MTYKRFLLYNLCVYCIVKDGAAIHAEIHNFIGQMDSGHFYEQYYKTKWNRNLAWFRRVQAPHSHFESSPASLVVLKDEEASRGVV